MPRKKLTKAQVKRKIKTCFNAWYDMLQDKISQANSDVPYSVNKMLEIHKTLLNSIKRMK